MRTLALAGREREERGRAAGRQFVGQRERDGALDQPRLERAREGIVDILFLFRAVGFQPEPVQLFPGRGVGVTTHHRKNHRARIGRDAGGIGEESVETGTATGDDVGIIQGAEPADERGAEGGSA